VPASNTPDIQAVGEKVEALLAQFASTSDPATAGRAEELVGLLVGQVAGRVPEEVTGPRQGLQQVGTFTGRSVRSAQSEHHRSIARAVRLGLSTRQIAAAAGVTHGTVRAITNRLSGEGPAEGDPAHEGEWSAQPAGGENGGGGEWAPE